jgi:phosphate starvation-inducible PhoH-like protein
MSKAKAKLQKEIQEGINEHKRTRKKSGISKTEFDKCGVELTEKQDMLYKGIKNNTMTLIHGPAGTSKTFTSCYTALALLANKKVEKIIITKPMEESGNSGVGYLPGDINEKTAPFKASFISNFEKIIGKQTTSFLISSGEIVFEPLAFMRGSTYDDSVMLLDEAQNCSIKDLMLWSTRLGKNSYMVIMGDTSQYDVSSKYSGFADFIKMSEGMDKLFNFKFENEDIVRNKFLIELTNRYDKYRIEKEK